VIDSVLLIALPVCFGNWTANALVTEQILQITFFCVLLIWQNPANMLNTNHLSFIYSFLLSLAFLLLMHCARHTFATTLCLSQGIPLSTVSKMLGHKQITTTQIYAQTTPIMIEDAIDRVESRLGGKFAV
jgi:hypothetical protein